jgi:hypothetical protein
MKPTMLNINKAKNLLRAMAEAVDWTAGAAVSPEEASRKQALGLSGDELEDVESYMSSQGWIDPTRGAQGARALTEAGVDVARKVRI